MTALRRRNLGSLLAGLQVHRTISSAVSCLQQLAAPDTQVAPNTKEMNYCSAVNDALHVAMSTNSK